MHQCISYPHRHLRLTLEAVDLSTQLVQQSFNILLLHRGEADTSVRLHREYYSVRVIVKACAEHVLLHQPTQTRLIASLAAAWLTHHIPCHESHIDILAFRVCRAATSRTRVVASSVFCFALVRFPSDTCMSGGLILRASHIPRTITSTHPMRGRFPTDALPARAEILHHPSPLSSCRRCDDQHRRIRCCCLCLAPLVSAFFHS